MTKDLTSLCVGILGFGEVAGMLASQLASCGVPVCVYDVNLQRRGGLAKLRARKGADLVHFLGMEEVAAKVDILLSTVPPGQAVAAARQAAPHLHSTTLYVDLASTGAQKKREINRLIVGAGCSFVEGVILEAVSLAQTRVRILLCGPSAAELALTLRSCGLNAQDLGRDIGRAADLKMVRSIVTKGIEAVLLEALTTARRKHLEQDLWATLSDLFATYGFDRIALAAIASHAAAARRRHAEMIDVVETVKGTGIEPVVSEGVREFFHRSASDAQTRAHQRRPAQLKQALETLATTLAHP
jgi:3-hydroxyisobutyrate dehydrogenase-like beta-hydroxyacid dehydrogenase